MSDSGKIKVELDSGGRRGLCRGCEVEPRPGEAMVELNLTEDFEDRHVEYLRLP